MLWWPELSKTLFCLTADGWGLVSSLLVVWPEATQYWSLPGLVGGAKCGLWEGSRQGVLPRTFAASVLVLMVSHSHHHPPASLGYRPTLAGRSGSVSPVVTAPSPGSRCAHHFVCALQKWSLCFPQFCQSPAIKSQ